ncbi:hypothetical protein OESDEN_04635 [Oesophagostomum dentatum]|uniref:Uncharacterized protein n=1 Tax=Oesophagostomum dentatum TaxID=61180 RepID=A0A0B1TJ27_OESDE|nr:hypothetical protein OESDEN_04635 [Oesophagostomum dentatum]
MSAQVDTSTLPKLNPKSKHLKRIVAVGFNETDLAGVVSDRGVAVKVPILFKPDDTENVLNAILGRPIPSRRPSTTRKPTTTKPTNEIRCLFVGDLYNFGSDDYSVHQVGFAVLYAEDADGIQRGKKKEPKQVLKCLFVGDLYNFGKNVEKYVDEAELISSVGYDFLDLEDANAAAGLWAYGYTTFSAFPDLSNFTSIYSKFLEKLEKMQFTDTASPVPTSNAIEAVNNIPVDDIRANCIVFFSAQ